MTERDKVMCSVRATKSAELVQTARKRFGCKMSKGEFNLIAFMPHHFICCSAAGIKKKKKLASSIVCSVLLKTVAEQLCLILIKFVLLAIQ